MLNQVEYLGRAARERWLDRLGDYLAATAGQPDAGALSPGPGTRHLPEEAE